MPVFLQRILKSGLKAVRLFNCHLNHVCFEAYESFMNNSGLRSYKQKRRITGLPHKEVLKQIRCNLNGYAVFVCCASELLYQIITGEDDFHFLRSAAIDLFLR